MKRKERVLGEIMYKLIARRILFVVMMSGLFAVTPATAQNHSGNRMQFPTATFKESQSAGITDPSVATDEQNNIEVYRAASPGVVFITSTSVGGDPFNSRPGRGTGSGSVIDAQGHILTNYHVIEGAQRLSVNLGGDRTYPARVVGTDADTDLAVIKIEAPTNQLTIVPLGDSDRLAIGQKVLAIGNPFGLDRTLTTGVISGLQRPIRARTNRLIEGAIQTDASINPGNSGGPLLDSRGRMIGVNSQILSPAGGSVGVGFAIPVNIVKRLLPQLIHSGFVNRPKLGIATRSVRELSSQMRLPVAEGAVILQVDPTGAAAASGLRGMSQTAEGAIVLGDIITAINGERVNNRDDLTRILDQRQVGDVIQVEIVRGNRRAAVPVRLLSDRRR